jgi:uncharacterized phage protein (TIGR01671 family)
MREIVFRGKEKANGKWMYGGVQRCGGDPGEKLFLVPYNFIQPITFVEIYPETFGDYIQHKDKNGKRIFEGDIIEDNFGNSGVITYSEHFLDWRIVFFKGRQDLINKDGARVFEWAYPMSLKVIGNIHDNAKLLSGEYKEVLWNG